MVILRSLVVLSFFVGTGCVMAQTAAPASAAPAPAAKTATCVKPGHYPGKRAQDDKKEAWHREIDAWGDCMKASVADLRANVADLKALIDAKIKLANSTVEEYNTGIKELQEEQKVAEMKGQVGK